MKQKRGAKKLKTGGCILLAAAMFFLAGRGAASFFTQWTETSAVVLPTVDNWGLGFGEEGTKPTGNVSAEELKQYDAYYMSESDDKVIYLTFDCGFENGNTENILAALKAHNVKATFFVVGHFLETSPDLVKEMLADGHTVGNHTYHHLDMSEISDIASFQKEIEDVEDKYKEITGEDMVKFYRPPQGKYSTENLKMAQELGYHTFFWSLAYVDWYEDDQPTPEEAYEKLLGRIHPGAIVLLHNTSKTNGDILDELLTKWEEMGYSFGTLSDLCEESESEEAVTDTESTESLENTESMESAMRTNTVSDADCILYTQN